MLRALLIVSALVLSACRTPAPVPTTPKREVVTARPDTVRVVKAITDTKVAVRGATDDATKASLAADAAKKIADGIRAGVVPSVEAAATLAAELEVVRSSLFRVSTQLRDATEALARSEGELMVVKDRADQQAAELAQVTAAHNAGIERENLLQQRLKEQEKYVLAEKLRADGWRKWAWRWSVTSGTLVLLIVAAIYFKAKLPFL